MIETTFTNEIANYTMGQITKVIINDSITITSFILEHVVGNVYELVLRVLANDTTLITNIKLAKTDETIITNNDVRIPIPDFEALIRQTITISEVTS